MSIGTSWHWRSRAVPFFSAWRLLCAVMVVALGLAGGATPMPAAAAAAIEDCASPHAGRNDEAGRADHVPGAASCCLFHCIPAVPLPAPPVAEPLRLFFRVPMGASEPLRGVTPSIIVPPPRA